MATEQTIKFNKGRKGNLVYPCVYAVAAQPALFYFKVIL